MGPVSEDLFDLGESPSCPPRQSESAKLATGRLKLDFGNQHASWRHVKENQRVVDQLPSTGRPHRT